MSLSSRRELFGGAAAALVPAAWSRAAELGFPLVDYHVHLNAMSLDQVVETSRTRGVKYGVIEHAGTKENEYPIVISNDAELQAWIAKLAAAPVYKGLQAEWIDWMPCFSKEVLAQLDFVLSDAMTVRDAAGKRIKAFGRDYDPGNDAEAFMKWYLDWMVEILEREPLDIFSHPTWLPRKFNQDFDRLWTPERMRTFIRAMKRTGTACEVDCGMKLPKLPFLQMAKEEGLKFSFGSNSGGKTVIDLGFCVDMAKTLDLTARDMFVTAPADRKPILRRKLRV